MAYSATSVLPAPVGAPTSTLRPSRMAAMARTWNSLSTSPRQLVSCSPALACEAALGSEKLTALAPRIRPSSLETAPARRYVSSAGGEHQEGPRSPRARRFGNAPAQAPPPSLSHPLAARRGTRHGSPEPKQTHQPDRPAARQLEDPFAPPGPRAARPAVEQAGLPVARRGARDPDLPRPLHRGSLAPPEPGRRRPGLRA